MGVYEDLLRKKKIIEDEQGNVTVNSIIDKNTRNKLADSSVQTYKKDLENNKIAINKMKNVIKRTAETTIWEQMQNIMRNRPITKPNFISHLNNSIKEENANEIANKNSGLLQDTKSLLKLTGLGASTGAKQTLNYIESANENNFSNYKDLKNTQFLTSKNVSEENKAKAKTQNNLLLQMKGINTDKTVETNLTKKAINESIEKDNQKIQEEQSLLSNPITQKLGEIAPSIGQQIPGIVASSVNPMLGVSYFTTSAGGNYIEDAKQRGMTDEQAFKYGTIMGAVEGSLEAVGAKLSTNVGKKLLKNNIKGALIDYGLDIGENFLEESIVEPISEFVIQETAGKEKANWNNILKRMWDSGVNGALVSAITGGASGLAGGVASNFQNNKYTDINTGEKLNKESQNWIKEAENIINSNNTLNLQQESIQTQQNMPTENNIANNQEMLYNGIESEGGINEGIQRLQRLSGQFGTRILEENSTESKKYSRKEYEQFESSIKPIEQNNLTSEQKQRINNYKRQYNKDIVFFDGTNNQGYIGGASINDKNKIYIDQNAIENFGEDKIINHEIIESDIRHNREISNNIIQPSIQKIINDPNFEQQKNIFWQEQEGEIPSDYAIAKEILCDRFAEIKTGENWDYDNVLSQETNMTIDYALENFHKELYGRSILAEDQGVIKKVTGARFQLPRSSNSSTVTRLQLPRNDASITNSILPTQQNVNSTINNYSMQNNKKYSLPEQETLKETNVDKYNTYKKNILNSRAEEVNNLIKNKNETIKEIEKQIKEKTQILNNKKDKTTKVANNLKMQIESLQQRKTKIENEYNSRIDRKFDKVTRDKINLETKKELGTTRKEIQQNLLEDTGILKESLDNAKNISMANTNRTDPIRLQEKVFGRELGTKINDMFFNKIKHNTANKTRFSNSERNDIKNWGIKARSFESEVLQKYTEKTYVTEEGKEIPYTEADLIKDIPNQETRNKIKKASEELRKKYDNYIETANEVLVGLGYDAIPKRKDYVRHFTELNDIFTKFGIPGKLDNALPTDINGITDTFRPGKNFFANAQQRHGNKTTYDAITGIDGYIEGISNLIYHTEDIQRLRAFDKYIREEYGEKAFENFDKLSEEDKKTRIQKISENHLSNYVSWLTEYTNNLAGKKSGIDRSVEKLLGRKVYSALDTIKKQTGSNMTGFNIGSALTNFISVTQGASKTKKTALLKGTIDTIKNIFHNDGFVDKSDFLTNRFGSNRISNTLWQKVSNTGQVFMSATDYFSSNLIVRSKYYENLAKGMNKVEALKKADDFGARILGDRSQGSTANIFNSKMLGVVTQFQLEVNNQLDTMIHDTMQDFKNTLNEKGGLKASMGAVWTLGQMAVYQYAFNEIFEAIAGRRPAFDIIDIIKTALGVDDDENDDDTVKDNLEEASVKLIEALPFVNLLSEDARIPIASAIPNPIKIATGDSNVKDEFSKLVYLLPPTGGSQFKKSIEGIKTVKDGGSYVINSKGEKELRFPVENANAVDYIKAGLLGKYSLPLAKEYANRDYKRLSAKQTKTYEESKVPYKEYLQYVDKKLKKNKDKIKYLSQQDWNVNQKWGIYVNDIFSSTKRKEDGGSQVSDAKYITSNGISKSEFIEIYNKAQKNNIDIPTAKEYKEMKQNGIILGNYIDYKINVKKETEKQKKDGKLKETENLKNKDKIQVLLDSNYSDKEKSAIYENYIKTQTKEGEYDSFDVIKASNMDIDEYLKYEQQEFSSDKKDDGTLDGKTVSKSKQKKVVSYLNSMNIEGNQRLLLYAMQGYSITSSQKSQLANYVYGLNIDKETKLELYNRFSGFKVYKNGTVNW